MKKEIVIEPATFRRRFDGYQSYDSAVYIELVKLLQLHTLKGLGDLPQPSWAYCEIPGNKRGIRVTAVLEVGEMIAVCTSCSSQRSYWVSGWAGGFSICQP